MLITPEWHPPVWGWGGVGSWWLDVCMKEFDFLGQDILNLHKNRVIPNKE